MWPLLFQELPNSVAVNVANRSSRQPWILCRCIFTVQYSRVVPQVITVCWSPWWRHTPGDSVCRRWRQEDPAQNHLRQYRVWGQHKLQEILTPTNQPTKAKIISVIVIQSHHIAISSLHAVLGTKPWVSKSLSMYFPNWTTPPGPCSLFLSTPRFSGGSGWPSTPYHFSISISAQIISTHCCTQLSSMFSLILLELLTARVFQRQRREEGKMEGESGWEEERGGVLWGLMRWLNR